MAGQPAREWQDAEDRADEFMQNWRFREAREAIEVFLTAHEAEHKQKATEALQQIALVADAVYCARRVIARDFEKKEFRDDAIRVYQGIIDKFGLDEYARKAQEEIDRSKARRTDHRTDRWACAACKSILFGGRELLAARFSTTENTGNTEMN